MTYKKQLITWKHSVIHVALYGKGENWMFCFHGFGEDAESFALFEKNLGDMYTLAAIDMPFHGKTEWKEGLLMKPDHMLEILSEIFKKNGKEKDNKFSILAFSLGGRIAMYLLQTIPTQIERVVLIAPDGLHKNFWYWLGTQTTAGNKLFAFTMRHPRWFFMLMNVAYKVGLSNKSIIKFALRYLDDNNMRLLLYTRWTTMRKFKPDLPSLKKIIATHSIPVRMLFGKYDRIILSKRSEFLRDDALNIKIKVIDAGHSLMREKYLPEIASLLNE